MKSRLVIIIILSFLLSSVLFTQQAEVTNVVAAQRTDGSQLVDITYDLTEDALFSVFNVSVAVSFEKSENFNATDYVTGDVGPGITSGSQKSIVWNIGVKYIDFFNDNTEIKITCTGTLISELPFEMIEIPAGEFTLGEQDEITVIDFDYEIMKYEVTNAQYAEFLILALNDGEIWLSNGRPVGLYPGDEFNPPGESFLYLGELEEVTHYGVISWNGATFVVNEGYGDHPVISVTYLGAILFANHYGLRLPTGEEWEKSARGTTGWDFPWGNTLVSGNANFEGNEFPWEYGTTPVGLFNGQVFEGFQTIDSPSPYGVYDLAGNVFEWTTDWLNIDGEYVRVIRGGSFSHPYYWSWFIETGYPIYNPGGAYNASNGLGFRCVRTIY